MSAPSSSRNTALWLTQLRALSSVALDRALSSTAKGVFAALVKRHNRRTGQCNPSLRRIADLRLQRAAELRLELPPPPLEWEPSADERGRVGPMFDALRAKISVPGSTVSEAERRAARTRVEAETAARRAAKLAAKSEPPESGE